ncbi:MAG: hypothetical protein JSR54_16380 [Proteobacteria bacterium]|nr:hypothetical protein [Pseudomonadota bacterium]
MGDPQASTTFADKRVSFMQRLLDEVRVIRDEYELLGLYDEAQLCGALNRWFGTYFLTYDAALRGGRPPREAG